MSLDSTTQTPRGKREKPEKPSPDFPLFPHDNGQWAKKVNGDLHYFGLWDKPNEALERWKQDEQAIREGDTRPSRHDGAATIGDVTDRKSSDSIRANSRSRR